MDRTSKEKLWLLGTAAAGFVLVLIGYFFLISPQRAQTSSVNDQVASAQTSNLGLQARIASLNAEYAKLTSYKQQLHVAQLALPTSSGMPAFLRTLQALSNQTATSLTNLTVGKPTNLDGGQVGAPAPATTSDSASASPADTTTTTAPATTGVYSIPITATVAGTRAQLSTFLTQLQSVQPRAVLITDVTVGAAQPAATTTQKLSVGRTTLDLSMQAFVAPDAVPVATTTTPVAGAYPSPSPSSSSAP